MNVSAPFICRPIATTLLVVAIVLLGGLGYRFLSVAALPTVEFPTIQVVTNWPGAAPDIVQSAISAPLEAGFGRIPGLALMTSTSSFGTSQITLQFKLTRPIAAAAQDVQAAINAAAGWLPTSQLPFPPTYHEINPADMPVLVIALTSETLPLHAITEFASTALIPKLSQVEGVGEVAMQGDQTRAVRLQVNPRQLAALGLSLEDVRKAIASTSTAMPKGQIEGPRNLFQVGTNDQLFDAAAFRDAIIAYAKARRSSSRISAKPSTRSERPAPRRAPAVPENILNVKRQPGSNIIQVGCDQLSYRAAEICAAWPITRRG
jgi:multidrug efflux pump